MIEIGKYNTLKILRETSVGLYLGDESGEDVLLQGRRRRLHEARMDDERCGCRRAGFDSHGRAHAAASEAVTRRSRY